MYRAASHGGLCPCPSSHGGTARPAGPRFQLQPTLPSHKKVGTELSLSNEISPPCSMGASSLCHSQVSMNFLQPSPEPLQCWGMLADPQGQAEAAASGLELSKSQQPAEGGLHLQLNWSFQRRDRESQTQ